MNIFKTLTVSVSVVMLLLTPLGAVKQADSAPAGKPYTMATAGTGGTFYVLGGAFSDMLRKHANTKIDPLSSLTAPLKTTASSGPSASPWRSTTRT